MKVELKEFFTDIVRYGTGCITSCGSRMTKNQLEGEMGSYAQRNYIIVGQLDYFLGPVAERIHYEVNLGFSKYETRFCPEANFDIGAYVEEEYQGNPEFYDSLIIIRKQNQ